MPSRIGAETAAKCAAAWPDILARIRDGELVAKVAGAYGLSRSMLWAYRAGSPELRKEWLEVMHDSADALFEDAIETARDTEIDPKRARVLCDMLTLAAEKRDPERYARRERHDVNVKSLDLTPILERAEARLQLAQAAGRVVEGIVLGTETEVSALM